MSKHGRAGLTLVEHRGQTEAAPPDRTRQLLLGWDEDDDAGQGVHRPGLADSYSTVVEWTTVRSVGDAGGRGGKDAPLPFNADAMDFLGGNYWADTERPMPSGQTDREQDELSDPLNYRPGFEPTILGLEASARRALGFGPAPRLRGEPLEPKPAVIAAMAWLAEALPALRERAPLLAEGLHTEVLRLWLKVRTMVNGARIKAGVNQCEHCYALSVVATDVDAVCINPMDKAPDGGRRCWWNDPDDPTSWWVSVTEPARGRAWSDEQLERLRIAL